MGPGFRRGDGDCGPGAVTQQAVQHPRFAVNDSSALASAMLRDLDNWFVHEVLPHEASLMRYLARVWPDRSEIEDIRHDAYVRILENAHRLRPTAPKSLLFSIARNLMVDRIRRNRVVSIDLMEDLDSLNVLVDEITPERRVSIHQQMTRVTAAINCLPDRCQAVFWLRRIENLSQKEIAAQLGISEGTVEKHMVRAIRLLADLLSMPEEPPSAPGGSLDLSRDFSNEQ
jgi:RNA polymerase sigma factor (sigma-70 family)